MKVYLDLNTSTVFTETPVDIGKNIVELKLATDSVGVNNIVAISGRMYLRKNQWYSFNREYSINYFHFNQYIGNKPTPSYIPELENGILIGKNYSKVELQFNEKRYHEKFKDIKYSLDVIRGSKILNIGTIKTTNSNPYRKNALSAYSFKFDFKEGDMLMIAGTHEENISNFSFINLTFNFE